MQYIMSMSHVISEYVVHAGHVEIRQCGGWCSWESSHERGQQLHMWQLMTMLMTHVSIVIYLGEQVGHGRGWRDGSGWWWHGREESLQHIIVHVNTHII
jgi:hypothetical protein